MNNLGFWLAGAIGMIFSGYESGVFGRVWEGINTKKEDLEVNWETLEKVEKELHEK